MRPHTRHRNTHPQKTTARLRSHQPAHPERQAGSDTRTLRPAAEKTVAGSDGPEAVRPRTEECYTEGSKQSLATPRNHTADSSAIQVDNSTRTGPDLPPKRQRQRSAYPRHLINSRPGPRQSRS
jgi:hypothetical protein